MFNPVNLLHSQSLWSSRHLVVVVLDIALHKSIYTFIGRFYMEAKIFMQGMFIDECMQESQNLNIEPPTLTAQVKTTILSFIINEESLFEPVDFWRCQKRS